VLLNAWLTERDITDGEFALRIGVSREYARLLRWGRSIPYVAIAERIREVTGGDVTGCDLEQAYHGYRKREKRHGTMDHVSLAG
jgi:hypothetical protein